MATSRTRSQYRNGILTFYDDQQRHETVMPMAPVQFYDDFLGQIIQTTEVWKAIDVSAAGLTTPLIVSGGNGLARMPLDATSEAQESGLYWNDIRPFVLNQGLVAEFVFSPKVVPTGSVVMVCGLAGNYNAAPDTVAESLWFRMDGATGGLVQVENDDITHETSKVSTGITLTTSTFAVGRIDCSNIADVRFFINGTRVAAGTTFNMSNVAGLLLQPYAHVSKGAATTVGTLDLDQVQIHQRRS